MAKVRKWKVYDPSEKLASKTKPQAAQTRPLPPPDESVPIVPEIKGNFKIVLTQLKAQAFQLVVERNFNDNTVSSNRPRQKRAAVRMSGYIAFSIYFQREFYNLPRQFLLKFVASAWSACPDKSVWRIYASQYCSYSRQEDFLTWLNAVPKTHNRFLSWVDSSGGDASPSVLPHALSPPQEENASRKLRFKHFDGGSI